MLVSANHFAQMFKDLVEDANMTKVPHYFMKDATINLNGKEMSYDDFKKRVHWMAHRKLQVTFEHALIDHNRAACVHYTTIEENGFSSVFKVFSHMHLKKGKITRFEHMTLKLSGEADYAVVNFILGGILNACSITKSIVLGGSFPANTQ